jgi:NADH-quinone oxidoreductase subunit A
MTVLVGYLVLFLALGVFFVFIHLVMGRFFRPVKPDPEKQTIYECGEPTIGSAWIQFDLRFYVVALLFVIFDVEVAFFFPWAVVFGKAATLASPQVTAERRIQLTDELLPRSVRTPANLVRDPDEGITAEPAYQLAWLAFWDIIVFFGVLLVGFAYLWKRGDLDWVRSTLAERATTLPAEEPLPTPEPPGLVGAGRP